MSIYRAGFPDGKRMPKPEWSQYISWQLIILSVVRDRRHTVRIEMVMGTGNVVRQVGKLTLDSAIGSLYSHNELIYPRLELPARRWTLYWLAQVLPIRRIL